MHETTHTGEKRDLRPRVLDRQSGLSVLLDSGAGCSLLPKDKVPDTIMDPNKHLMAVNGSKIPTYGTRLIKIQPTENNIFYWHRVILALVQDTLVTMQV